LVAVGDEVAAEDPLITLESDKATMEVPAPSAGKVTELKVAVGDKVSEGAVILVMDSVDGDAPPRRRPPRRRARGAEGGGRRQRPGRRARRRSRRLPAAFRAADLGLKVRWSTTASGSAASA
jgi:pyruvate/2-oxoglutarate dehydrogenase complex dihydrolipoamide acyltransferase (E2) component